MEYSHSVLLNVIDIDTSFNNLVKLYTRIKLELDYVPEVLAIAF
jgi:hypothetical protein